MPQAAAYQRIILVVEDEALLRDLVAKNLESSGFQVATAANASDAKRILKSLDPDAMVVDVELGEGPNGFDLADSVTKVNPDIGIVFLTNVPDPRFVGRGDRSVAKNHAYLSKSSLASGNELVQALEVTLRERVTDDYRHNLRTDSPLGRLSRRQIEVLRLMAAGYSNQQIADARGSSVRAVESMISRIFEAFELDPAGGTNVRVEAVANYLRASRLGKSA
jgi:DNA-binding NarL/FixJ family response regulator